MKRLLAILSVLLISSFVTANATCYCEQCPLGYALTKDTCSQNGAACSGSCVCTNIDDNDDNISKSCKFDPSMTVGSDGSSPPPPPPPSLLDLF